VSNGDAADDAKARASARAISGGADDVEAPGAVLSISPSLTVGLLQRVPRLQDKGPWKDFVALLELLVSSEYRGQPAKQIALILERGYEQYLLENYENADSRAEDIRGLALYAQRYESTETFLSELALLSTERFAEAQPLAGEDVISGGEEDIANLALRLAISQMIAERAGQPLSLLVLDEIFGSLDEDRRLAVVDLLRSLADRFPQVILITHIDSVRDGFDRVIRVGLDVTRGVATARDEPLAGHDVAA